MVILKIFTCQEVQWSSSCLEAYCQTFYAGPILCRRGMSRSPLSIDKVSREDEDLGAPNGGFHICQTRTRWRFPSLTKESW